MHRQSRKETPEFFSLSSCFVKTLFPLLSSSLHQLRPLLPSRHATWTPSPPRCVCSSRSEKCVRRSCKRPLRAPTSSECRPKSASLRPNAPRSISQAERTEGRSSRGTAVAAPRSPKVKDPKAKRSVTLPCRMPLIVRSDASGIHSPWH